MVELKLSEKIMGLTLEAKRQALDGANGNNEIYEARVSEFLQKEDYAKNSRVIVDRCFAAQVSSTPIESMPFVYLDGYEAISHGLSGVYIISAFNTISDVRKVVYVGKSVDIRRRLAEHRRETVDQLDPSAYCNFIAHLFMFRGEQLPLIESEFIKRFQPVLNKSKGEHRHD